MIKTMPAPKYHIGDIIVFREGNFKVVGILSQGKITDAWLDTLNHTPEWSYEVRFRNNQVTNRKESEIVQNLIGISE